MIENCVGDDKGLADAALRGCFTRNRSTALDEAKIPFQHSIPGPFRYAVFFLYSLTKVSKL